MAANSIPKIIHYCWIGNKPKPREVLEYIENWKKLLPDYEIKEWNEHNFDFSNVCNYAKEAYEEKKWAFVTDYMRLSVLYKYGGIYLDTDVEILKAFDELLNHSAFMCYECSFTVCTAVIGAEKHSKIIGDLLQTYNSRKFRQNDGRLDTTPNSRYIFDYLSNNYGMLYNGETFETKDIVVYPEYFFSPMNYATRTMGDSSKSYAIHWYSGTWKSKGKKLQDRIMAAVTKIIGEKKRERLVATIKGVLK